jgi:nicotinate phosphoribosyltransferase
VPNAIRTARELESRGHRLVGIRIDSGDLAFLSRRARQMLDQENLPYVKIVASNELDEYIISDILNQGGKVRCLGSRHEPGDRRGCGRRRAGRHLQNGRTQRPAQNQIKRKSRKDDQYGTKKIIRYYDAEGFMEADALAADSEDVNDCGVLIVDPNNPLRRKKLDSARRTELLQPIVEAGNLVYAFPSIEQIRQHRIADFARLHESHKRLHNPHEYKVGLTHALWQQKEHMLTQATV